MMPFGVFATIASSEESTIEASSAILSLVGALRVAMCSDYTSVDNRVQYLLPGAGIEVYLACWTAKIEVVTNAAIGLVLLTCCAFLPLGLAGEPARQPDF